MKIVIVMVMMVIGFFSFAGNVNDNQNKLNQYKLFSDADLNRLVMISEIEKNNQMMNLYKSTNNVTKTYEKILNLAQNIGPDIYKMVIDFEYETGDKTQSQKEEYIQLSTFYNIMLEVKKDDPNKEKIMDQIKGLFKREKEKVIARNNRNKQTLDIELYNKQIIYNNKTIKEDELKKIIRDKNIKYISICLDSENKENVEKLKKWILTNTKVKSINSISI